MIFTFLIIIVFIAELILAIAIFAGLIKLMKKTKDLNVLVIEAQPKLRDICILFRGISAQLVEFSQRFVEKFSQKSEDVALRFLTKLLGAMLLWKLNSKTVNTLRKSKLAKLLGKGLSILETMV